MPVYQIDVKGKFREMVVAYGIKMIRSVPLTAFSFGKEEKTLLNSYWETNTYQK